MPDSDFALLESQLRQVWDSFETYRKFRLEWDDWIRRRGVIELPPELAVYARLFNHQTPDLEWAVQEYIAIETLGQTKIDCKSLEPGPKAERDVEDTRMWTAASELEDNEDRRLDLARAEAIVRYGVSVERLMWAMPEEPDSGEMPDTVEGAIAWANKSLKDRDSYYHDSKGIFRTVVVNPLECAWFPLDKPRLFFQHSVIPIIEAYDLTNDLGEHVSLDELGKLCFVGESEPLPEYSATDQGSQRMVRFLVRDACDPKTGQWTITEWVESDSTSDAWQLPHKTDNRLMLREYPNPLGICSYFVTPAGTELPSERDPHLRLRPRIYRLLTIAVEMNYWITRLAALAHKKESDEDVYINITGLSADLVDKMDEMGMIEGVGAQRRLVFQRPEPGTGEIPLSPRLEKWPNDVTPQAELVFTWLQQEWEKAKPNRFLTGNQGQQEMREAPATSMLDARQAAAVPIGMDLQKGDVTIRRKAEAKHRAILYWDAEADEEAEKPYFLPSTSDLSIFKGEPELSESPYINATKLKRKFIISVLTKNETQAEKYQNDLMAYQDYDRGTINGVQLLRRLGHDDPNHQMEELWAADRDREAQQRYLPILAKAQDTIFFALSGMAPPPDMPMQAQGQPVQNPGLPNPNSPGLGQVGNALAMREGPAGGSSPMVGAGA